MAESGRIARAEEALHTEVEGSVVILHSGDGIYYQLDGVAVRVWELLAEPMTFESLLAALLSEFEVEPERCRSDLASLLEELEAHRLVVPGGGALTAAGGKGDGGD
ncbi:hypothetical protein MAMC_00254 [Methylacidimicrobium cyclopophantes]|uniref:PqqD family protein n=2 Tax=Methylacidimicrobium cyclopophantes TaxID=1041766 RepID=A0A5E6M6B0_9BACT|nr:hypothetical protein MAMC_00254 [Methylacidimicrobium cyclopophantes]